MTLKPLLLLITLLTAALVFLLSACGMEDTSKTTEPILISTTEGQSTTSQTSLRQTEDSTADTYIILDDEKTTINGDNATFADNVLSITAGGTYHITGSLSDGKILVNSSDETKKVKLILAGVNLSCSTDAPLFIENSPDETVLILESGTINSFSDTARSVAETETDYATATIYSKDDLQIEGDGSLSVTGKFNKGIFSKNDIDIRGGNISITASDDGIRGKDSVEISAGNISITCGGDGIRTSEELEADKGFIDISGGSISIESSLDGIQATGSLTISDGEITVTSAGGATEDYYSVSERGNNSPFDFMSDKKRAPDSSFYEEAGSASPSSKGIKSAKELTVNGGTITLNCLDDSLHAPYVTVNSGTLTLASDDDGIHADEQADINGGKITVTTSYEGVEGRIINITSGSLNVTSDDDGFNAAYSDSTENETASPFNGGRPGGMMDYDSSCTINMSGGFVLINAQGDGIDSNGNVIMTGGRMIVFGPTNNGNGALDYGGTFVISKGTVMAVGSRGMAQSVSGNGVPVINFALDGNADTVYSLTDEYNRCIIAFKSPKQFQNIVIASDRLSTGSSYNFCQNGSVSGYTDFENGICFDGTYTPGTILHTLS